eukprot:gb/GFBE01013779.1/.p1 GENE.gb/GFBE01013779.1/~~gb/GFBE01013779.1/.p1  ORF type:complete len:537 (+),score=124.85 gb/GFBE01013779.1/:1-1611(+)
MEKADMKPMRLLAAGLLAVSLVVLLLVGQTADHQVMGRRLKALKADLLNMVSGQSSAAEVSEPVGHFLRSMELVEGADHGQFTLSPRDAEDLQGVSHYRLAPGIFPKGMHFHFDGLATVLKFEFSDGKLSYTAKAYESDAEKDYGSCIFIATGTGPTIGSHPCLTNPAVNLLPIKGQLWLTIDTSKWGRVDPATLETTPDTVSVESTVLNAHPACDPRTGDCFVQYNCGHGMAPITDQACFALLQPGEGNMKTVEISRATLPKSKLIQHSHSPCVTPHFLVSKLDAFVGRNPLNSNTGMLRYLHQGEDNLWMVMDRKTNKSRILKSTASFVNNHFWNCYETEGGEIVADAVAATEDYLDNYFFRNLAVPAPDWDRLFHPPVRCRIPASGNGTIVCDPFFKDSSSAPLFDYPTFNPKFKMNAKYQFFYGIAPKSPSSRWFDQLIKVDAQKRAVVNTWSSDGIYLTEADFIPRRNSEGQEDSGILISVLYNSTSDSSSLGLFDASSLAMINQYQLNSVIPFHAHGIVCESGKPCYPNP